jgi:hypothetical protein
MPSMNLRNIEYTSLCGIGGSRRVIERTSLSTFTYFTRSEAEAGAGAVMRLSTTQPSLTPLDLKLKFSMSAAWR